MWWWCCCGGGGGGGVVVVWWWCREGTVGVQMEYTGGTVAVQWGTVGVQWGYSRGPGVVEVVVLLEVVVLVEVVGIGIVDNPIRLDSIFALSGIVRNV